MARRADYSKQFDSASQQILNPSTSRPPFIVLSSLLADESPYFYVGEGSAQSLGTGPISYMISLWQDQTSLMASGVPIPAPLGSPAGPNLNFTGE